MDVLDRKAKAIPQQLQSYSIKQFKDSTTTDKQVKKTSTLPSMEKDQEIARLRKELALLKVQKGDAVVESKETKQVVFGGAKATKEKERVEVIERERSVDQQPKIKSPVAKIANMAVVERRRSASQTDNDDDSQTAVITVDQGRGRRSSAYTSSTRSSTDSVELRREPRYHSPRTSKDLGRRDFCVVQVTEPLPRTRQGSKEVTRFREVTVYRKEARYTAVH
jgi:hypothetical protein